MEKTIKLYTKTDRFELTVKLTRDNKTQRSAETLEQVSGISRLSICGSHDVAYNGHWRDCCGGQNCDEFRSFLSQLSEERKAAGLELFEIWDRWHLNDLRAGTTEQNKLVDAWIAEGWRYDYGEVCKRLEAVGMYEDRGYKYGVEWLYESLPEGLEVRIEELLERLQKG